MTGDDPIASLLRATGRRPAVPAARSARVREAARTVWQAEVARRLRSRRLALALALAATVLLAIWGVRTLRGPTSSMAASNVVEVDRVVSTVWAEHGRFPGLRRRWDLQAHARIDPGCTIRTAEDGRAALHLLMGPHVLRLDHATVLRILSDRVFVLERGAVYVDSGTAGTHAGSIHIETARGTVEDVGTQFEVRLSGDALTVRVREGQVAVDTGAGSARAAAGQALTVDGAGRISPSLDRGGGWEWMETVAPPFLIEGRALADFLAWAARERGARVRYLDAGLAARARGIVLHGSVEGMELDRAVASVALTSGLIHRWQDGELVVSEAP